VAAGAPIVAALAIVAAVAGAPGCASEPPPPPRRRLGPLQAEAARYHPVKPPPVIETPASVAAKLGIDPAELQWSASHKKYAAAVAPAAAPSPPPGPPPHRGRAPASTVTAPPAIYRLAVYRASGEKLGDFEAARAGTVGELRFLDEDRLVYRLTPPPPAPKRARGSRRPILKSTARASARKPHAGPTAPSAPPALVYVIQPLQPAAQPMVCEGRRFTFSPRGDHIAWVAGDPGSELVGADGAQVYPRTGVTVIRGDLAWSTEGDSLALIEGGAAPRLVVLVEIDNPSGDNSWPLPPEAVDPKPPDPPTTRKGRARLKTAKASEAATPPAAAPLQPFWVGPGKIVVGPDATHPVFATSFVREPSPPPATPPAPQPPSAQEEP
jgi:hypothetical protein